MTDLTPLDRTHAAMQADAANDAARLAFYGALADAELFILLTHEPKGRTALSPEILDVEGDRFVLAFDREERLTDFAKTADSDATPALPATPPLPATPAPYAALPGRVIAGMLAGQGIGIGLNLGVAPSSILIPAEAMDWLQAALAEPPEQAHAVIEAFLPLGNEQLSPLITGLISGLTGKLAAAGAVGAQAWLARARFAGAPTGGQGRGETGAQSVAAAGAETDETGLVLGLIGIPDVAHEKLARAAQEALVFSGQDMADVATLFLDAASPAARQMAALGCEIPLPRPAPTAPAAGVAGVAEPKAPPGSDPDKPPILR